MQRRPRRLVPRRRGPVVSSTAGFGCSAFRRSTSEHPATPAAVAASAINRSRRANDVVMGHGSAAIEVRPIRPAEAASRRGTCRRRVPRAVPGERELPNLPRLDDVIVVHRPILDP